VNNHIVLSADFIFGASASVLEAALLIWSIRFYKSRLFRTRLNPPYAPKFRRLGPVS